MSAFPVADTAEQATQPDRPVARTEQAATRLAGGPVYLAMQELPGAHLTIAAAEAAVAGLYDEPRFEVISRDNAYRVVVRFWRPARPRAGHSATPARQTRRASSWARPPNASASRYGAPTRHAPAHSPRSPRRTCRKGWRKSSSATGASWCSSLSGGRSPRASRPPNGRNWTSAPPRRCAPPNRSCRLTSACLSAWRRKIRPSCWLKKATGECAASNRRAPGFTCSSCARARPAARRTCPAPFWRRVYPWPPPACRSRRRSSVCRRTAWPSDPSFQSGADPS